MYRQSPGSLGAAKRTIVEGPKDDQPSAKRRRRVFSCESCQRLKCKCDFDSDSQSCRRCYNLRIPCSRREEIEATGQPRIESSKSLMGIENRLRETQETLQELQTLVLSLSSRETKADDTRETKLHDGDSGNRLSPASNLDDLERMLDPTDHVVAGAPIVVLREIGQRCTNVHTRPRSLKNVNLLEMGIISLAEADQLIKIFLRYQKYNFLVGELSETASSAKLLEVSPFLHSVCCLQAIPYQGDKVAASTYAKVYDEVRLSLGQVLLASPLTLAEILGVFLMSNNGPPRAGEIPDFIDSWMLTGYCAKQAMLSISFSEIIKKIKTSTSTTEDERAIRLWSTICLHHLHWAASTGRPSTIPSAYLENCNMLLSFYDATMQDGMILAEVLLYANLLQKLETKRFSQQHRGSHDFGMWKQRWNHLLVLPTASMLKVGYFSARLILAARTLQELDEDLSSDTFMSVPPISDPGARTHLSGDERPDKDKTKANLRAEICSYAHTILQTFLQMPTHIQGSISSNRCLSLHYSALILAHYDEAKSKLSDRSSLDLIIRLNQWLRSDLSKSWAIRLGEVAEGKINSRLSGPQTRQHPARPRNGLINHEQRYFESGMETGEGCAGGAQTTGSISPNVMNLESGVDVRGYEFEWGEIFPNMEDFFTGGFLNFSSAE